MEIVEILGYELNHSSDSVEVRFRLIEDSEDEIRIGIVELKNADDFGYNLISEEFGFYDEEEEDEDGYTEYNDINESQLISFLNEYYMIYPDRLPKKE